MCLTGLNALKNIINSDTCMHNFSFYFGGSKIILDEIIFKTMTSNFHPVQGKETDVTINIILIGRMLFRCKTSKKILEKKSSGVALTQISLTYIKLKNKKNYYQHYIHI